MSPLAIGVLAAVSLALAALPALLTLANLRAFARTPRSPVTQPRPADSVLVPARTEEAAIGRYFRSNSATPVTLSRSARGT